MGSDVHYLTKETIMGCGNRKESSKHGLCPISFGLAVGITCFLAVIVAMLWITYFGASSSMMMHGMTMPAMSWSAALVHALWALVKGFVFGLVLALLYDLFVCCGKKRRCGDASSCEGKACGCRCPCCDKNQCACKEGCDCTCGCCKK